LPSPSPFQKVSKLDLDKGDKLAGISDDLPVSMSDLEKDKGASPESKNIEESRD
jgi:hypothetical protein